MEVVIYTKPGCPKCAILKKKLTQKGIEFTEIEDEKELIRIGRANKITSAPILKVNNAVFNLSTANDWVNDYDSTKANDEPECEEECKF